MTEFDESRPATAEELREGLDESDQNMLWLMEQIEALPGKKPFGAYRMLIRNLLVGARMGENGRDGRLLTYSITGIDLSECPHPEVKDGWW